jgi:xylulokinase
MWLEAVDLLLQRLKHHVNLKDIKAISGAGMQHGTVFWSQQSEHLLQNVGKDGLVGLKDAFAHPFSPNWQVSLSLVY